MAEAATVGDVGVDVVKGDGCRRFAGPGEEKLDVTCVVNVRRCVRIAATQPLLRTVDLGEHGTPPGIRCVYLIIRRTVA